MLTIRTNHKISYNISGFTVQIGIFALFTLGLINNNDNIINLCSLLSIVFFALFNVEDCIYFLFSVTIFENAFTLFGVKSIMFLIFILSVRILLRFSFKLPQKLIFPMIILISIEVLRNILNASMGMILNNVSLIFLFVMLAATGNKIKLNIRKIILSFGLSISLSMIFVISYYGGLRTYLNAFTFNLSN